MGTGKDGHAAGCVRDPPWDLLQKSFSSTAGGGEGAGAGVKPTFPNVPHSTNVDIGHGRAGNRERVVLGDKPALGKPHRHPTGIFLSWRSLLEEGRVGASSMSSVGLQTSCPQRCLPVGSLAGNGDGLPGMASTLRAEEWFVCCIPREQLEQYFLPLFCLLSYECLGAAKGREGVGGTWYLCFEV